MMASQPPVEPLRRWDPERIGPYTLRGRLGAGAMGQVYLGRSTAGRLVAVKTIKVEFAEEPGFRSRFAHEVVAARRVSGVFTASVVAADPEADVPWLATAYIPAPSLNQLVLACGSLPVPATRWLAAGCAEALESIHNAGLVHRDLKPSNVLVSPDGPRVIDFGVARAAERIQLTVTRGAVGTPAYMAPEQARDTRQASVASDVFSLGATLLFAATGHPPYQGETVMDILVRLATEPPDLTALPAELTGLITACLQRSPRDRPTSAALLRQLEPFVDGAGDAATGHPYLTDAAIDLIAAYQQGTHPAAHAGAASEISDDATFGSHLALPQPRFPPARQWPLRRLVRQWRLGRLPTPDRMENREPAGSGQLKHRPRRRGKVLPAVALACAAVALATTGVLVGESVKGSDSPARGSADRGGMPLRPPGPPGPPPSMLPTGVSSTPELRLNQNFGDGNTVFVIHGSGWIPLTPVTVTLAGRGASPVRPTVDRRGTFNYAIDQGHEFFAGAIPAGTYRVVVTGSAGRRASAVFQVGPGPPPRSFPPSGR